MQIHASLHQKFAIRTGTDLARVSANLINNFLLSQGILNFLNKIFKYLKLRFIINLDISNRGFGVIKLSSINFKNILFVICSLRMTPLCILLN